MHHSFFDKYSDGESLIHKVDPRVKCISALFIIVVVVSIPIDRPLALSIIAVLIAAVATLSRIPFLYFLKRIALVVPFAIVVTITLALAQHDRLNSSVADLIAFHLSKVFLAVTVLTVLSGTTSYQKIISSLSFFRAPKILTSLLYFFYRFIYLVIDEIEELSVARESRDLGGSVYLNLKSRAWLLGTFLVRSANRSDVIYRAMAARGFDGSPPRVLNLAKLKFAQVFILAVVLLAFLLIRFGVPA